MAGKGARFKEPLPKQFQPLGGKRVYEYALETLEKSALFDEIVLVVPPEASIVNGVLGGKTRQQSSYKGLEAVSKKCDYVLIHDAVRPFVTKEILERNVSAVKEYNAVNTCISSTDSINLKVEGKNTKIFARGCCLRGQTPQTFSYPLLVEAHQKSKQTDASCDCSLLLEMGYPVHIVEGEEKNFKITSPFDLQFAQFLLAKEELAHLY